MPPDLCNVLGRRLRDLAEACRDAGRQSKPLFCADRHLVLDEVILVTVGSLYRHTAFAYVWNKSDDWCSEFGSVAIQSGFGGITRIG